MKGIPISAQVSYKKIFRNGKVEFYSENQLYKNSKQYRALMGMKLPTESGKINYTRRFDIIC